MELTVVLVGSFPSSFSQMFLYFSWEAMDLALASSCVPWCGDPNHLVISLYSELVWVRERERDHWPQEDSYALKKQKNYFEKYVCYQKWLISVVLPLIGFEKGLFKRMNEKRATETEAYLWSVSDMWLGSVWIKMMAICFLCISGKDTKDSQHQLKICSIN